MGGAGRNRSGRDRSGGESMDRCREPRYIDDRGARARRGIRDGTREIGRPLEDVGHSIAFHSSVADVLPRTGSRRAEILFELEIPSLPIARDGPCERLTLDRGSGERRPVASAGCADRLEGYKQLCRMVEVQLVGGR